MELAEVAILVTLISLAYPVVLSCNVTCGSLNGQPAYSFSPAWSTIACSAGCGKWPTSPLGCKRCCDRSDTTVTGEQDMDRKLQKDPKRRRSEIAVDSAGTFNPTVVPKSGAANYPQDRKKSKARSTGTFNSTVVPKSSVQNYTQDSEKSKARSTVIIIVVPIVVLIFILILVFGIRLYCKRRLTPKGPSQSPVGNEDDMRHGANDEHIPLSIQETGSSSDNMERGVRV